VTCFLRACKGDLIAACLHTANLVCTLVPNQAALCCLHLIFPAKARSRVFVNDRIACHKNVQWFGCQKLTRLARASHLVPLFAEHVSKWFNNKAPQ
jgi:hypothetical protein